jgi:tRNA(Ile2) C34 agmatinyltransferase TiaS
MTALLLDTPRITSRPEFPPARPQLTLEALVTTAWTRLGARGHAACPVCAGHMESRPAGDGTTAGACSACGSQLR